MIKLIVGLGNPGRQYQATRHNAGFWFLEGMQNQGWLSESRFNGEVSTCSIAGQNVILLKPDTYMNRSGMSVGKLARYYRFQPEQILVVHDELDLKVGEVRLKKAGGHAGHNGLKDIIANLGSRDFMRLRLGIGRPQNSLKVVDYVLADASKEERQIIECAFEKVYGYLDLIVNNDFERAMNALHG
ncbi:MAG: aminoacyl-tRNA hydrolase [Gammaproteobacteria bacterium HGW-Gammaproteobacteria-3]|nr:MAG: aminoacyl-tRNA hydrolase [Gammaproteobacteria bacterium HGW-Gammaproteobacteria-3]